MCLLGFQTSLSGTGRSDIWHPRYSCPAGIGKRARWRWRRRKCCSTGNKTNCIPHWPNSWNSAKAHAQYEIHFGRGHCCCPKSQSQGAIYTLFKAKEASGTQQFPAGTDDRSSSQWLPPQATSKFQQRWYAGHHAGIGNATPPRTSRCVSITARITFHLSKH